ncbi:hypothetical protein QYF61_017239 [Mycteria americana]|uniref:Uncharacterized protein n=1 Tax=Mycteria americana TaxID=33587 RepID=A0AAN7NI60_MYCAM|nr:hypothetical protein QYF61_017239 [Mycteria americana]
MGEGDTNSIAADKPRFGMASPEGGNASGNIYTASGSTEGSGAYLKCLYTNAHSIRNKQDELEALVSSQSYNIIGISETWWNESHDWSAGTEGYRLFRRDRQGRRGGGVALYVRERFDCTALAISDDVVKSLWGEDTKGQSSIRVETSQCCCVKVLPNKCEVLYPLQCYFNILGTLKDGHLTNRDEEKAEAFNAFLACVFNNTDRLWAAWSPESEDHEGGNSDFPFVNTETVRDQLRQLNVHKSMEPDGINPRVLKELVDVMAGPLSIIRDLGSLGRSLLTGS